MKQRDIFQIIVRGVGLIVFLWGLEDVFYGVMYINGVEGFSSDVLGRARGATGALQLVVGCFLMRGFTPLVNFAFGRDLADRGEESKSAPKSQRD